MSRMTPSHPCDKTASCPAPTTKELRVFFADRRTVFFLGAGASVTAGLPLGDAAGRAIAHSIINAGRLASLWRPLAVALNSGHRHRAQTWPRFEVIVSVVSRHLPDAPRQLLECFRGFGRSSCHASLARLSRYPRIWLTTNFDDQIEAALVPSSVPTVLSSHRGILSIRRVESHLVVKLHGDSVGVATDPTTTIDQLLRTFPRSAQRALVRLLRGRPLLIVGYAARDPDLVPLLDKLVHGSSQILWVGMGKPNLRTAELIARHPHAHYLDAGFDDAIAGPLGLAVAGPAVRSTKWGARMNRWAVQQDPVKLRRILVDLALVINNPAARKIALRSVGPAYPDASDRVALSDKRLDILFRMHPRPTRKIRSELARFEGMLKSRTQTPEVTVANLCALAKAWQRQGDYERALARVTEALRLVRGQRASLAHFKASLAYGRLAVFRGGGLFRHGIDRLRFAGGLARRKGEMVLALDAIESMAIGLMRANRPALAEKALRECEEAEREIGNPTRLVSFRVNLAETRRLQNDFAGAARILDEIRPVADAIGDFEMRVMVYANSGLTTICAGEPAKASALLEQTQELCGGAAGDLDADICQNLGWMRLMLACWREALPFFDRGYGLYRKLGSTERAGASLAYAGWCWLELADRRQARRCLSRMRRERLVPRGLFAGDAEMLDLFLGSLPPYRKFQECRRLATEPDIHFRGLAHLFRYEVLAFDRRQLHEIACELVACALRSNMPFLLAQADELLSGTRGRWQSLRRKLRRRGFRPLAEYFTELAGCWSA